MIYAFNEEKMFMDVADGVAIVINSESGIYYGMNTFGTAVFTALTEGMDTDKVSASLQALTGAPTDMDARCSSFVQKLTEYELLIPGSTSQDAVFDAELAANDHFELDVTAFDDVQEMLLADPLHEVKEETGWTPEKDSIGYTKEETRAREGKVR